MTVLLDPGLGYTDKRLAELHRLWRDKQALRGALPARADFSPAEMRSFITDLYMVDVLPGLPGAAAARFRYRLIGTAITARTERDVTGRFFDEIYGADTLENFSASFHWIARHKLPLRSYGTMDFSNKGFLAFEALEVPLASDDSTVDIILGVMALLPGQ